MTLNFATTGLRVLCYQLQLVFELPVKEEILDLIYNYTILIVLVTLMCRAYWAATQNKYLNLFLYKSELLFLLSRYVLIVLV